MKHPTIEPIIGEARARRAVTPANGDVIQRALVASQQEERTSRRPVSLALSLALAGTVTVGIGIVRLRTVPHVANTESRVAKAEPHITNAKSYVANTVPRTAHAKPYVARAKPYVARAVLRVARAANAKFPPRDDLDIINKGGSEAAIQHWAQLPQDEQDAQLERIKAIVKGGDDFIDIPLPTVATTATAAAAEALATKQSDR
jgi:hypothetical protein